MLESSRPPGSKAVFLSYTTEDTPIALAVCEALREAGIEVWMDHSALQGGDAWDNNIRRQLRDCALIIPIISARTQGRHEGYFRLEWKLADERSSLVAEGKPLLVPVVVDDTKQQEALVPKSFLAVQWTRLPQGHVPPAFVARIKKLLDPDSVVTPTTAPFMTPSAAIDTGRMEVVPEERFVPVRRIDRAVQARPLWLRAMPLAAAAVVAVLSTLAIQRLLRPATIATPTPVNRFAYDMPDDLDFRRSGSTVLAVSPDGRSYVFNTTKGIYLKTMEELDARLIPGTAEDLSVLFFSPDGKHIAYFVVNSGGASGGGRVLKRIPISGGSPTVIAQLPNVPRNASWAPDDSILYAMNDGIWRVNAKGGTPSLVLKAGAGEQFQNPRLLPDGDSVLLDILSAGSAAGGNDRIAVQSIKSGKRTFLDQNGTDAHYVSTGHLVYAVGDSLFAATFDLKRLAITGTPANVIQNVRPANRSVNFDITNDGNLIYVAGSTLSAQRTLMWVDRQGLEAPIGSPPSGYVYPRISPDGTRVALDTRDALNGGATAKIWVVNLADGGTRTLLTVGDDTGMYPVWNPDGTRVAYSGQSSGEIYSRTANTSSDRALIAGDARKPGADGANPYFFTPDGQKLVFRSSALGGEGMEDIGIVDIKPGSKPDWLLNGAFNERNAELSPNGRWIAYQSDESTGWEIYVRPFPNVNADRVQVSSGGGRMPVWSRDGHELFFISSVSAPSSVVMNVTTVETGGPKFTFTGRKRLMTWPYYGANSIGRTYDISPDGQRFLVIKNLQTEATIPRFIVVQNWTEELKRLMPTK